MALPFIFLSLFSLSFITRAYAYTLFAPTNPVFVGVSVNIPWTRAEIDTSSSFFIGLKHEGSLISTLFVQTARLSSGNIPWTFTEAGVGYSFQMLAAGPESNSPDPADGQETAKFNVLARIPDRPRSSTTVITTPPTRSTTVSTEQTSPTPQASTEDPRTPEPTTSARETSATSTAETGSEGSEIGSSRGSLAGSSTNRAGASATESGRQNSNSEDQSSVDATSEGAAIPGPTNSDESPTSPNPDTPKKSKIGLIIGIVIGLLSVIVLVILGLCLRRRRIRQQQRHGQAQDMVSIPLESAGAREGEPASTYEMSGKLRPQTFLDGSSQDTFNQDTMEFPPEIKQPLTPSTSNSVDATPDRTSVSYAAGGSSDAREIDDSPLVQDLQAQVQEMTDVTDDILLLSASLSMRESMDDPPPGYTPAPPTARSRISSTPSYATVPEPADRQNRASRRWRESATPTYVTIPEVPPPQRATSRASRRWRESATPSYVTVPEVPPLQSATSRTSRSSRWRESSTPSYVTVPELPGSTPTS